MVETTSVFAEEPDVHRGQGIQHAQIRRWGLQDRRPEEPMEPDELDRCVRELMAGVQSHTRNPLHFGMIEGHLCQSVNSLS